jgi:hypothetical protein
MRIFQEVQPGDLITAELINKVIHEIEQLADRLDQIDTSAPPDGTVRITGLVGARRVGSLLEVRGRNFAVPVHLNEVAIDERVVGPEFFGVGNSDERIFFIVPDEFEGLPREVPLRVTANNSSDSIRFMLYPEEALPGGTLIITLSRVSPEHGTIGAGSTYELTFDVTAITTMVETYDVEASVDQSWALNTGGSGTPRTTIEIPQADAPGTTRQATVAVTIPPGTPQQTTGNLTVTVRSQRNLAFHRDRIVPIEVGSPPPGVQTAAIVAFSGTVTSPGSVSNGVVQIPGTSTNVNVNFLIRLAEGAPAGRYRFFGTLEDSTGWTVSPTSSAPRILDMAPGASTPSAIRLNAASDAATPNLLITRLELEEDVQVAGEDRRRCIRT